MVITKERTRIKITEYTDLEKKRIDDLVGTMDKVFSYEDIDNRFVCFPTGMWDSCKKLFPKASFVDNSEEYWPYNSITPVEHQAKPRNQLQIDFINFIIDNANKKRKLAGILSPGTGKALPINTRIPTPNGYKLMKSIKVGDTIFGSDGRPTKVTGVYDQGKKEVYEVTFSDGRKIKCCKEHLWNVYVNNSKKQRTVELQDMLEDYKTTSGNHIIRYRYSIPIISHPVEYKHKKVPVPAYVIGAFIGHGWGTSDLFRMGCSSSFVPNKVAKLLKAYACKINNSDKFNFSFYDQINGEVLHTKDVFKTLPEMMCKSQDKRIPKIYMYNSVSVRMELLRGLLDTNGSIHNDGSITYSSTSSKLLEQICEIVHSLGYKASIAHYQSDAYSNGYIGEITIRIPNDMKKHFFTIPNRLNRARRFALKSSHCNASKIYIHDIKKVRDQQCRCISVDAPDHLYVAGDFIVTHNTFMACYAAIKVGLRTLIIVPTSGIKNQWAETLTNMFGVPASRVKTINSPADFINVKADFVIVSQASLAVLNKTYDLEKIMKDNKFGIKVIDEVQMWFHNIIKVDANCKIANNWYLTGTFGRSGDEENALYQEMFGDLSIFREKDKKPTLFNPKPGNVYGMKPHMNCKMMWTKSGLSKEEIASVSGSMRYSERAGKWMRYGISIPAYTELVIPSDGRMTRFLKNIIKVIDMAEKEVDYGSTLVLTPTIASVEILREHVEKMFPDKKVGTYHSRNTKAENDKNKATCDILISTVKSCGTGFDVKGLSKLIVAEQFKSWILADQVSGRLRRRPDGKDTYMWDIVDASIPQLRAWANARADVLRRKSKSFKVIDL